MRIPDAAFTTCRSAAVCTLVAVVLAAAASPCAAANITVTAAQTRTKVEARGPFETFHSTTTQSDSRSSGRIDMPASESARVDEAAARVDSHGVATVDVAFEDFECGGTYCRSTLDTQAAAKWADQWYLEPADDAAYGTSARLRITLSVDGVASSTAPLESGWWWGATLELNGTTLTLTGRAPAGTLHESITGYFDFDYVEGQYVRPRLELSSFGATDGSALSFSGLASFSARITEVALPLGTTLTHSLTGLHVINSSDPNLYPTPIPEPGTAALLLAGLACAAAVARRPRGGKPDA